MPGHRRAALGGRHRRRRPAVADPRRLFGACHQPILVKVRWSRATLPLPDTKGAGPSAHARRLPKGLRPSRPGEIVQRDTPGVCLGADRRTLKQSTACDPLAKWTCAQACRRASAHNAKNFPDKLQAEYLAQLTANQTQPSHMH